MPTGYCEKGNVRTTYTRDGIINQNLDIGMNFNGNIKVIDSNIIINTLENESYISKIIEGIKDVIRENLDKRVIFLVF